MIQIMEAKKGVRIKVEKEKKILNVEISDKFKTYHSVPCGFQTCYSYCVKSVHGVVAPIFIVSPHKSTTIIFVVHSYYYLPENIYIMSLKLILKGMQC